MAMIADAIVVGGGITGCSIAFQLASHGLRVTLLERRSIASGPTGSSPAILRCYYKDPALTLLAQLSLRLFHEWRGQDGRNCGFVRTGFLTGVTSSELPGDTSHFLNVDDMTGLLPDLVPDGLAGGIYEPDAGYCDPVATASALITAANSSGRLTIQDCTAERILISSGHVSGVETSIGTIAAPVIVNAAGPWAARLAAASGMELPIQATRHAVALVQLPTEPGLPELPGYAERGAGFYLRPSAADLCFVGSLDPADSRVVDPDSCDTDVIESDMRLYRLRAGRRLTRLARSQPRGGWASLFDMTPDGNPLVGRDARAIGSFLAVGLSGHGFKFFPLIGRALADLVTKGRTDLPLEVFATDRLLRLCPVTGGIRTA